MRMTSSSRPGLAERRRHLWPQRRSLSSSRHLAARQLRVPPPPPPPALPDVGDDADDDDEEDDDGPLDDTEDVPNATETAPGPAETVLDDNSDGDADGGNVPVSSSTTTRSGPTGLVPTAGVSTTSSTTDESATATAAVGEDEDAVDEDGAEEFTPTRSAEPNVAASDAAGSTTVPTLPTSHSDLGLAIGILLGSLGALACILIGLKYFARWRRSKRKRPPLIPPASGHSASGSSPRSRQHSSHSRRRSVPVTVSSPHPGVRSAIPPPSLTTTGATTTATNSGMDWPAFDIEKARQLDDSSTTTDASSVRTGHDAKSSSTTAAAAATAAAPPMTTAPAAAVLSHDGGSGDAEPYRVSAFEMFDGPPLEREGGSKRDSFWPRQYGINMDFDRELASPTMRRQPLPTADNDARTDKSSEAR